MLDKIKNWLTPAKKDPTKQIIAFLNSRAEELYRLGGVHIRESVALGEAALMIEHGYHNDDQVLVEKLSNNTDDKDEYVSAQRPPGLAIGKKRNFIIKI